MTQRRTDKVQATARRWCGIEASNRCQDLATRVAWPEG
jgi:hypothetical protein